jgi:hypothetical protein
VAQHSYDALAEETVRIYGELRAEGTDARRA